VKANRRKMRVLVVDDDPMVLKATTRQLQRRHFDVVSVGGVSEARTVLETQKIDAVVTDRDMPEGGGAVVCQIAVGHNVPSVVYTGNPNGLPSRPWVLLKPATEQELTAAVWWVLHDQGKVF